VAALRSYVAPAARTTLDDLHRATPWVWLLPALLAPRPVGAPWCSLHRLRPQGRDYQHPGWAGAHTGFMPLRLTARPERCRFRERVLPSARNIGFQGPAPTSKRPLKARPLPITTRGVEKRWGFFGPIRSRRPSKTRSGTKGLGCLGASPPFAPWGLHYDFGASGNLET
jgi:hypothetical protein